MDDYPPEIPQEHTTRKEVTRMLIVAAIVCTLLYIALAAFESCTGIRP